MNCKEVSNLFCDYLADTLSGETKQQLEEHLQSCPSCQKDWKTYQLFFTNSSMENDFPVPSQLNAKIKYTINQAKNKKKVPFYRNRQVLSYATACCFLLVAGIFGTSHYQQLKTEIQNPSATNEIQVVLQEPVATQSPIATQAPSQPTLAPTKSISQPALVTDVVAPAVSPAAEPIVAEEPVVANEPVVAAEETDHQTQETTTYAREVDEPMAIAEQPEDINLSIEFKDALLEQYPHTELAKNTYAVAITKAELSAFVQSELPLDEKCEYVIVFVE